MALFFVAACAHTHYDAFEHNLAAEDLFATCGSLDGVGVLEGPAYAVFLCPLDEFALEVDLFFLYALKAEQVAEDAVFHEIFAAGIAAVEINGADEGLKGIATHVVMVKVEVLVGLYEAVKAHFVGQVVERGALYDFAAQIGEETFVLAGVAMIENVAHHSLKHGIAQKLQTLVVANLARLAAALRGDETRLVRKGFTIDIDVVGIEAHDVIERRRETLVATELVFDLINKV